MGHRTTFALDDSTIRRLKRLAKAWGVSQAEVVRRAIERADSAQESRYDPLEKLRSFHSAGGMDRNAAKTYLEEVAENRAEWGREG